MNLLHDLVAIPSPTGNEATAVAFMQDQARRDGFCVHTDHAGNFIAEAGKGERLLLLVGHIDTVPGHIPVRVEDGALWGRGSVDAKGSLVAAYLAARRFLDDDRLRIRIVGAVDEEGHSAGAKALPRDMDPHWILIGEPSGWDGVALGYKGILRGHFTAARTMTHGAHPQAGAADVAVSFWGSVTDSLHSGTGFDDIHVRLGAVGSDEDGLQQTVTGSFEVRLPPSLAPDRATAALEELATGHGIDVRIDEAMPAAVAPRRTDLVAALSHAIRRHGATPRLKHKTGTADFNHLASWFPGVPIAAYGPGDSALDHTPEERLSLADLERAVAVLEQVFETLAGLDPAMREANVQDLAT